MIKHLDETNFTDFISNGTTLIDFYADWCQPCKAINPIIEEISFERNDIRVGKVDADKHMDLCRSHNVRNIPTIIIFNNGIEIERTTGIKSKKNLFDIIDKLEVKS